MTQGILVVGGGQGIGLEITLAILARKTANVVVFGLHIDPQLNSPSERLWVVTGDVTSDSDRKKAVETALDKLGSIDTLVYTAGVITPIERIESINLEAVKQAYEVNVFGVMAMVSSKPTISRTE
jgi:NAD(P)-dependent dehydrogenase (short-subunit alcohol dehydrogenase family)